MDDLILTPFFPHKICMTIVAFAQSLFVQTLVCHSRHKSANPKPHEQRIQISPKSPATQHGCFQHLFCKETAAGLYNDQCLPSSGKKKHCFSLISSSLNSKPLLSCQSLDVRGRCRGCWEMSWMLGRVILTDYGDDKASCGTQLLFLLHTGTQAAYYKA